MEVQEQKKEYYKAIDGLRAYAVIGVVMMHIKENGNYNISWFGMEKVIGSFGELVFLFMIISGFSMCCGYYDKMMNREISLDTFYKKRYAKIWPYFALLCFIDIIMNPALDSLKETFANLTLCFGLLPNAKISVVGVGWFVGLCFVFYLIFPFFCFLLSDKKRAIFSFGVALIFNLLCSNYFFNTEHVTSGYDFRSNIIYCAVFFLLGGIIYLFRVKISKISQRFSILILLVCVIATIIFFIIGKNVFTLLFMFSFYLIYAIGTFKKFSLLNNAVTKFLSGVSLEIYLGHMMIFRGVEKAQLLRLSKNEGVSYIISLLLVIIGTILFAVVAKKVFGRIKGITEKRGAV